MDSEKSSPVPSSSKTVATIPRKRKNTSPLDVSFYDNEPVMTSSDDDDGPQVEPSWSFTKYTPERIDAMRRHILELSDPVSAERYFLSDGKRSAKAPRRSEPKESGKRQNATSPRLAARESAEDAMRQVNKGRTSYTARKLDMDSPLLRSSPMKDWSFSDAPPNPTLFSGVTCYIDVRFNDTNRNDCVETTLRGYGAKLEKTFNRKVTHVIYKAGCFSTYLEATDLKVPIVSLLWIQACIKAGRLVNPALYPPAREHSFLNDNLGRCDSLSGITPLEPSSPRSEENKSLEAQSADSEDKD